MLNMSGSFMTSWPDQWRSFGVGHRESLGSPLYLNTTKTSSSTPLSWSFLFYDCRTGKELTLKTKRRISTVFYDLNMTNVSLLMSAQKTHQVSVQQPCFSSLLLFAVVTFQIKPRGRKADLLRRLGVAPTAVPEGIRGVDRQHCWVLLQPSKDEPGCFHLLLHMHPRTGHWWAKTNTIFKFWLSFMCFLKNQNENEVVILGTWRY